MEEELYSNVKEKIDIENANIFDLLEWRFDFENLDLCSNFNLHQGNEPFLVKIKHSCAAVVKGRCLPGDTYVDIQPLGIKNSLWNLSLIVNRIGFAVMV